MMARPGGELAAAQPPQLAAQRLGADRDAELLPNPLRQVDQPPAHHAVDGRDRAALDHLRQRLPLGRPQLRRRAGRLAVDQPRGPLGVEAQHPVPHDLQRHAADLGRLAARPPVMDRRQGRQPTRLRCVPRASRLPAQGIGGEVRAERERRGHGEHPSVRHGESRLRLLGNPPRESRSPRVGITGGVPQTAGRHGMDFRHLGGAE